MAERLTIGVPAFNEANTIGKTLDSILSQEFPPGMSFEVVVCVRPGEDNTEEIVLKLANQHPEIRLITTEFLGKPYAVNTIVREADKATDIFIFSDADITVDKDTFNKLVQSIKENEKVHLVGAHLAMLTEGSRGIMRLINPILASAPPKGTLNGRLYAITREAISQIFPIPPYFGLDAFNVNLNARAFYTPPLILGEYMQYRIRCDVGHYQIKHTTQFDVTPYSTFYGRSNYLRELPLRQKVMLPLIGAVALYCRLYARDACNWGVIREITRAPSTKRVI